MSSLLSDDIFNSLRNTAFYFRFGVLVLIICYLLDNYEKFKLFFFNSLSITLIIVISYSFLEFFFFSNIENNTRVSGLFGDELIQGSFLLRIVPIFFIFSFYNKEKIFVKKSFLFVFIVILLTSFFLIILSGERSAIFLMTLCIFLSFLFFKLNFKKIILCLLLFFTLFVSTFYLYPESKERIVNQTIKQVFFIQDKAGYNIGKNLNIFSEGHQDHLEAGFLMFQENYIFGVGVRNFRIECKKDIYKIVGKYHCSTHPHNTYMQLLSETGLIGFSFIVVFLFFVFLQIFVFYKKNYRQKKKLNISLAACFIIILINFFPFMTSGSFFNNWLSTLYYIPIGLLLHELNNEKLLND
ncbi:O-antigen ligase family protein [Candidatus Pelagibacter sp.]|nr:O-antigen ligase family protein [Candidatus Pelagibacter sp.]